MERYTIIETMEAAALEFKVTYYVGVMLAQGGALRIHDDHLLFVPRNIEKAMGASDVEIPFSQIKMVEVTGTITESLIVRTQEKAHRFVGADLQKIQETINRSLSQSKPKYPSDTSSSQPSDGKDGMAKRVAAAAERTGSSTQCPSCFKVMKPDYNFCPACGMAIKKICPACHKGLELHWKFCAFCGTAI